MNVITIMISLLGLQLILYRVYEELVREHNKTYSDNNKCVWQQDADPEVFPNLWRTECGYPFWLDSDKPSDNHMKYCCYCGKEIAEGE